MRGYDTADLQILFHNSLIAKTRYAGWSGCSGSMVITLTL
jgi:hypothetical protein